MRALAHHAPSGPFTEIELPEPTPGPRDLIVDVRAVSVNPVDTKVHAGDPEGGPKVLGYDAAGVVTAVGEAVSLFSVGDEVYHSGSIARQGTNAQLHAVDERIVGPKPRTLSFAEAAALPLTTITAWESLFDRFRVAPDDTGTLLVMGAAGGVGSMIIQLARALTGLTLIGTASREESRAWATDLGAHHVIGHHDLVADTRAIAPNGVDRIFSPFTAGMIETYAEVMSTGGGIVAIDEPEGLDTLPLKDRSQSLHWELMFTRPLFEPPDMVVQHDLLARTAELVDAGAVRTTLTERLDGLTPENLARAHEQVADGHMVGKVVITA
ncbi:zinc-binding alcohol dehydrogenase family protein [Actinomycetospora endophytica]|uniref:Zinc-type alcohol dehydrogenase-like protein n=1 Tax=Actinomycetospora endophytica TaxID=2291215 RepID=A0ABS8PB38_9PSEU|nr:zinc-binding alcohol dehydrogenase family protein [Actinomycetospora endophytica]MCD2195479.1 zinc-binding alcohol dehydrogenase family protein [Actinomycetospora endophytica]